MDQRDQDRNDLFFILRLIDIDTELVMQGDRLFANDRNQVFLLVSDVVVHLQDMAIDRPAQLLNMDDVLGNVP